MIQRLLQVGVGPSAGDDVCAASVAAVKGDLFNLIFKFEFIF